MLHIFVYCLLLYSFIVGFKFSPTNAMCTHIVLISNSHFIMC